MTYSPFTEFRVIKRPELLRGNVILLIFRMYFGHTTAVLLIFAIQVGPRLTIWGLVGTTFRHERKSKTQDQTTIEDPGDGEDMGVTRLTPPW